MRSHPFTVPAQPAPRSRRGRASLAIAFSFLLVGCGAAVPPNELVSARSAYEEADQGQARQLVPDRLLEAQQALDAAEKAFEDDGASDRTRTRAYVAHRKAQLAMAMAEIAAARRIRDEIEREYQSELESAQRDTRERLGETETELQRTKVELTQQERELQAKQRELAEREQQLAEREEQLAREREARLEAEAKAAAALASLEEIANVNEDKRGTVITLSGAVLFKTNAATLLPIAERQLGRVAEALREQHESKRIRVEGHTDSRGSVASNRRLSRDRAESVRAFLVSAGVDPTRIVAVGKGEDEPIASNRTAEGRANNRRVEIVIGDGP